METPYRGSAQMIRKLVAVAGSILAAGAASTAPATVLLSDSFDSYADQAAFESVWPPSGADAPESGALSTLQASSSPNSIFNPGTLTPGQSQNTRFFTETPVLTIGARLVWSFDFFDSAPAGNPQRNHSQLLDTSPLGTFNQQIIVGLNNNQNSAQSGGQYYMARISGYVVPLTPDPDGGPSESVGGNVFFKLNDFTAPHRTAGWHNLKTIISTDDGASTDYEFYVDGVLAERVSNVGPAVDIRQYDVIALGSAQANANTEVYFDNVKLEFIEPVIQGDFNDDFVVNLMDYLILVANLHTDVSQLLPAQSYPLGNITGDREINGHDFLGFVKAFDDFNGVGAFQAMLAAVPEPSATTLALASAILVGATRRRLNPSHIAAGLPKFDRRAIAA
jgi:hypothetical protein